MSRDRASEYRRMAERLRNLSMGAKSEEAQQDFSRCARMYERLANASPGGRPKDMREQQVQRQLEPGRPQFGDSRSASGD